MKVVNFIKDDDFKHILRLVELFSQSTNTPYHQHVNELTLSLLNPTYLTITGKNDDKLNDGGFVAYLVGYYLNQNDFMITQLYSEDPQITSILLSFLENHLQSQGITRLFGLSKPHPRVFERYGFKVERYVMSKDIKGGK